MGEKTIASGQLAGSGVRRLAGGSAISAPGRWAACLDLRDAGAAGRLRRVHGIEVCQAGEELWLRGEGLDEALQQRLRALPGAQRFFVLPDGQLLAPEARVPAGWLPNGPWTPLARWMGMEFPVAGLGGRAPERVPLLLMRAGAQTLEPPSTVLLTTIERWAAYAGTAPQLRLDRLQFAVANDGRVVVRGTPLPPLPGERFVEHEGVAVQAGWTWSPRVEAALLREVFQLEATDLALWHGSGFWERVPGQHFVRATRAAARASLTFND